MSPTTTLVAVLGALTRRIALLAIPLAFLCIGAPAASADAGGSALRQLQAGTISAGLDTSCAVRGNLRVWCWGHGGSREARPTPVSGLFNAASVAVGDRHVCAGTRAGTVACWGSNDENQIGDDGIDESGVPVPVSDLEDVRQLSAGALHTCAVTGAGEVMCWGNNEYGQLGNGSTDNSVKGPELVQGLENAVAVSASAEHTCAVLLGGEVRCWGDNFWGRLGDGTTDPSLEPVAVSGIDDAVAITTGHNFSCALREGGSVSCWGYNGFGQLGHGSEVQGSYVPSPVPGVSASGISAGSDHVCAWSAAGSVSCWGHNGSGQAGAPGVATPAPVGEVAGVTQARAVAAGDRHSCAIEASDSIVCWGENEQGQSDGEPGEDIPSPVVVAGVSGIGAVADLELRASAQLSNPPAGQPGEITVTVSNRGMDAVAATVAMEIPADFTVASAAAGSGTVAGGVWQLGLLEPEAEVTLTLVGSRQTSGVVPVTAEIESSSGLDPDSVPGNGDVDEDDWARAKLTFGPPLPDPGGGPGSGENPGQGGPGAGTGTGTGTGTGSSGARPKPKLALRANRVPRTGRLRITGQVRLPRAGLQRSCRGPVMLQAKSGRRTAKRSVRLTRKGRRCTFAAQLRDPGRGAGKVAVVATLRASAWHKAARVRFVLPRRPGS